MFRNYIKTAIRNLYRYKLYSIINILGLAVGIASVIMIYLIVQEEVQFNFHNEHIERIFRVNKVYTMNGQQNVNLSTPYPLRSALMESVTGVENAAQLYSTRGIVKYGDKVFRERDLCSASPEIFEIFTFNFLQGDPGSALQDLSSIAISASAANKYFGDENALGKTIQLNNRNDMIVTAVYKDMPVLSDHRYDFIYNIGLVTEPDDENNWYSHWLETYILAGEGVDRSDLEQRTDALMRKNIEEQSGARLQSLSEIHLFSVEGNPTTQKYIYIFSSIAILILIIACINFMNLATAQASKRVREVGVRKISGAQRKGLITQFLGESFCYTLIAFLLAILIVELSLPYFGEIVGREIGFKILTVRNLIYLAIMLIVVAVVSGSYPAFLLSSYLPVKVFKSGFTAGKKGLNLRTVIVIVQFTLAISILIGTAIIYSQLTYMREKDLGFDNENLVYLRLNRNLSSKFEIFRSECEKIPEIRNICRTSSHPDKIWNIMRGLTWEGKKSDEGSAFGFLSADRNIVETLDLKLIMGRDFSEELGTDEQAILLNRASLAMMEVEDPIGMMIGDGDYEVIGVVEDFNSLPLQYKVEPLLITVLPDYLFYIFMKIDEGDPTEVMNKVEKVWMKICPDFPFEFMFLNETFQYTYDEEIKAGMLFKVFAALGIFIACLGLFGLTSYLIENKKKEIGIRKVLGSSTGDLIWKLSKNFLLWVVIANFISFPVTWYFMNRWLQGFMYRTELDPVIFVISGSATCLIALATIIFRLWRAANTNPASVLKYE